MNLCLILQLFTFNSWNVLVQLICEGIKSLATGLKAALRRSSSCWGDDLYGQFALMWSSPIFDRHI